MVIASHPDSLARTPTLQRGRILVQNRLLQLSSASATGIPGTQRVAYRIRTIVFIPDAIEGLRRRVCNIRRLQILPCTKIDHIAAAVGSRTNRHATSNGLRITCGTSRASAGAGMKQGQGRSARVEGYVPRCCTGRRDVELPQIANQVAAKDEINDTILIDVYGRDRGKAVGARCALRSQRSASASADLFDQSASLQINDVEHCRASATCTAGGLSIVVAVTKYRCPRAVGHSHDIRSAEGIAKVDIIGVAEFPHHQGRGITFTEIIRIGDVQCKHTLAAACQTAHQDGMPSTIIVGVAYGWRAVDIITMRITWGS